MDSTPLSQNHSSSTLNGGTSHITRTTSDNSMVNDNESNENATITRKYRRAIRSVRPGSTYIKNYRLSRYNNALYSTLPFRRQNVSMEELPVDSVGCFSNSTFMWVRKFKVSLAKSPKSQLPTVTSIEEPTILPKATYTDSCNVNAKRLLGMYKYEEQTNGRINGSMLRVAWKFCQTRLIISSIIRTLSILFGIVGITLFLDIILHAKLSQSDYEKKRHDFAPMGLESFNGNKTQEAQWHLINGEIARERYKQMYFSIAFVLCFAAMYYLKSVSNWLDLRTAIRLRTACVAAAFSKSLNSSVLYKIAPHQIISLSCDESELICTMIMKGTNLISHLFGIIFCFIAAVVLMGAPGMWPLFGILGLFLGAIVLSKISVVFNRRSLAHLGKKLSIVEDFCTSFSNTTFLNLHDTFRKRFSHAISCQYLALFRAETFRPNFSGGITSAILLGGLYLIWCDVEINTDKIPVLVLVLLYAFIVQFLVAEWCESIDAVWQGKVVLEKVKNSIILSPPKPSKSKPGKDLKISITDACFEWEQPLSHTKMNGVGVKPTFILKLDELHIPRNQLIGITGAPGSGKSSVIYALLGHMSHKSGNYLQKGTASFFPEQPYTIEGSVKDNIIFFEEFHSLKYYSAISLAQLNNDILCSYPGYDDVPIDYLELNSQQLQKISLARAIFCERDTVILEEPLSAFESDMDISDTFQSVSEKLLEMGKTVIVVTQNDSILRHCQKIYVMVDGQTSGYCEYDEIQKLASYQDMLHNYRLHRDATRESNNDHISNRASQPFAHASTEELVASDKTRKPTNRPRLISCCETLFLIILHLLNTLAYVFLPFTFVMFSVQGENCMPWLATTIFGLIVWLFLTNLLIKHFLYKLARRSNKKLQRSIFEKLLSTSLAYINDTKLSDILNVFMDNNLAAFHTRSTTIHCWLTALAAGIAVGLAFFGWMAIFVIGCYLDFFVKYYYYRSTIAHFASLEDRSRRKLLQHIASQLKGRAVIQSFDKIEESRNRTFNIIEQNSTSVFLRKSTIYYTQFLFNCWQILNLILLMAVYIFYSKSNIYGYVIVLFGFFTITSNLYQLLEVRFDKVIADQKLEYAQRFLEGISTIGLNSDEPAKKENGGIPIAFDSVTVRSNGKEVLRIKKLNIERGQTIGIRGKGSHLFGELMLRKIEPSSGALFLGGREIASYSNSYLRKNIGIVPHNPLIYGATISSLLQAGYDFPYNSITSALQRFNLQAKLMKLDEPLSNLSQVERQLLCLAKCWLTMPAILIIDKPLPEIQSVIDESIRGYFKNSTVIVIGSDDSQFMHCCDEMVNISEK